MTTLAGGLQRLWGKHGKRARTVESKEAEGSATTGGSVSQEPVVVWQAVNPMEAQIVKGRLQSAGIPAIVTRRIHGQDIRIRLRRTRRARCPGARSAGRIRRGDSVRGDPVGTRT